MEMSTINPHEERARTRKVCALVAVLSSAFDGRGIPSDEVEQFDDEQWEMALAVASERERDGHVYGPASEETKRLALSSLRVREADKARAPDPFSGL
jgi:hypothetical protein